MNHPEFLSNQPSLRRDEKLKKVDARQKKPPTLNCRKQSKQRAKEAFHIDAAQV
jgi:hypothetical protein